jgi:DNA-directed RNA polymerase specialized sigma24 family protein
MSNVNPKPWGRPRKRVVDPDRASRVLAALRDEHIAQIEGAERRRQLALEAAELGVTTSNIAEAIGSKQTTVSLWVRRARDERDGTSTLNQTEA